MMGGLMELSQLDIGGLVAEVRELLEEQTNRLGQLVDHAESEATREQYLSRWEGGNADATGVVELPVRLPTGTAWLIKRVATTAGAGGAFALYFGEGGLDAGDLIDYDPAAQINAREVTIYVPAGASITARFFTQPNGQRCTVRLQMRQLLQGNQ